MKLNSMFLMTLGFAAGGQAFAAGPSRCAPGYQDSSCVGVLLNAPQAAPTCSAGAGWTTTAPATWAGSKYTPPQCSFTAAPNCAPGYVQSQAPNWNGTQWVGLQCAPAITPPGPPVSCGSNNCVGQGNPWAQPAITLRAYSGAAAWGGILKVSNTGQGWAIGTPNATSPSNGTLCMISAGQTCNVGWSTPFSDQDHNSYTGTFLDIWNSCVLNRNFFNQGSNALGAYQSPWGGNVGGWEAIYATANLDGSLSIYTIDYLDNSSDTTGITGAWNYGVVPAGFSGSSYTLTNDSSFDGIFYGRCAPPAN